MSIVESVTDETFGECVLRSELPVLVDFWAAWCGPCKAMTPLIEELAKDYQSRFRIVKIDADANARTRTQYGVRAIPCFLLFKQGEVKAAIFGSSPRSKLAAAMDSVLQA